MTVYTPPLSLAGFFYSEAFTSLVVGPFGSTKTTASLLKIAYHASRMAPCKDGIRRSRAVVVRNTREQLADTTIPDFLKWFPDGEAGIFEKTAKKFVLRFNDVECEVLFRGLDDANDVKRLLSLQLSFAFMDEFREIHPDIFEALQGRIGRYPDKSMVIPRPEWGVDDKGNPVGGCVTDTGKPNDHLWGATNPPDMDTWWEGFLSHPPSNARVFFQPGGMDPAADWLKYLKSGYYENLMEGKSQDWIDVYVHAKFGRSLAGRPVHSEFKREFHIAKQQLMPFRSNSNPLVLGFDFGLNPSCTINQIDPQGRLLTYSARTSDGMGILRFTRTILKPLMANRFAGMPALIVGDPAGSQRAQTDERSVFECLVAEGFNVIPASTNARAARITALDSWLAKQVDGAAAHLIDPQDCSVLIDALRSGYRYKRKRDGEFEVLPEKNLASHVAEAHQYACLHADKGSTFGYIAPKRREIKRVSAAGWT